MEGPVRRGCFGLRRRLPAGYRPGCRRGRGAGHAAPARSRMPDARGQRTFQIGRAACTLAQSHARPRDGRTLRPGSLCISDAPGGGPGRTARKRRISLYLAPGLQFGAFSQELSLSIGRAAVTTFDVVPGDLSSYGGGWAARGLRLIGVTHSWSPPALHALLFVSFGGWGWGWGAFRVELGLGGRG